MREGEAAESVYIVASGRVEVVDERPPETLIRVLRRGAVLGELALLREGTRSASARARRDTELLELSRAGFEDLIQQAPSFALGLTRAMGAQLAASHTPVAYAPTPNTIAVVGIDQAAPAADIAAELADALGVRVGRPAARRRAGGDRPGRAGRGPGDPVRRGRPRGGVVAHVPARQRPRDRGHLRQARPALARAGGGAARVRADRARKRGRRGDAGRAAAAGGTGDRRRARSIAPRSRRPRGGSRAARSGWCYPGAEPGPLLTSARWRS